MITRNDQKEVNDILKSVESYSVYGSVFTCKCFHAINCIKTVGLGNAIVDIYSRNINKDTNSSALLKLIGSHLFEVQKLDENGTITENIQSRIVIKDWTRKDSILACERLKFAERLSEGSWGRADCSRI